MSFPIRTFPISCKNEDFPTPVSPTRRIVITSSLVLITPFVRVTTLLRIQSEHDVSKRCCKLILDSQALFFIVFQGVLGLTSRIADEHAGDDVVTGRTIQFIGYPWPVQRYTERLTARA